MGVELSSPIILSEATPRTESLIIPGRSGVIKKWDGSYESRTITAECYLLRHTVERDINAVNSWLVSEPGYFRFEDTADFKHFMYAQALSGVDRQLRASLMIAFELVFEADPRRFLKSGERGMLIWDPAQSIYNYRIINPTLYASSPLLKMTVESKKKYEFEFENGKITVHSGEYSGVLFYDSENDRAYNETVDMNEFVVSEGDIRLPGGESTIGVSANGNGRLEILPRWWEI